MLHVIFMLFEFVKQIDFTFIKVNDKLLLVYKNIVEYYLKELGDDNAIKK